MTSVVKTDFNEFLIIIHWESQTTNAISNSFVNIFSDKYLPSLATMIQVNHIIRGNVWVSREGIVAISKQSHPKYNCYCNNETNPNPCMCKDQRHSSPGRYMNLCSNTSCLVLSIFIDNLHISTLCLQLSKKGTWVNIGKVFLKVDMYYILN